MKVTMHINVEVEGAADIERLGAMAGQLEEALNLLTGEVNVGATRSNKPAPAPTTSEGEGTNEKSGDLNDDSEEERLVERKTYFHHPKSECVFILEKGDSWPSDPCCEPVSKKTYEELLEKYEGGSDDTGSSDVDPGEDTAPSEDSIDFMEDLVPAFKQLAEQKGPAAAKVLITDLGVKKLSELDPADYSKAMKAIKDVMAG